ncbi:MAG: hypothetical protein JNK64_29845 [Myxococcales bacterium]|nr:hypothetical protein [Myxococcales bacterium]
MTRGALVVAAVLAVPALAHAGAKDPDGRVVFARGTSLWLTDGRGKATATAIATLPGPAADVQMIRTDAAGTTLLVELAGAWWTAPMPAPGATTTLTKLGCGAGAARLSLGGDCVVCASATGKTLLIRLADGKQFTRDAPGATVHLAEKDGARSLVWSDGGAVRAAPITDRKQVKVVAPEAPLRGLVVSPDGTRAVGTYLAPPPGPPKGEAAREYLMGFPLDGSTARRRLIRDGVVIDWSWDSAWLLIQDGGKACIARAVGGEYKCWKGYTAVSISPDGAWGLVLGPRDGAAGGDDATPAQVEEGGGDDEGEVDDGKVALPTGPLSLYRVRLPGTYTERPTLIEREVDGAAAWLPLAAPRTPETAPPAAPKAPTPAPAPAPAPK